MALRALKIVEEEFAGLCRDFPYLMGRVSNRCIDSTTVWDLIDRIKKRIAEECVEQPDPADTVDLTKVGEELIGRLFDGPDAAANEDR